VIHAPLALDPDGDGQPNTDPFSFLEKLAEKADMGWPYLSEIERGRENISLDKLARLAQALNVRLSKLVENA
jgi:transcriptional regulator with XRE-family HTH domain